MSGLREAIVAAQGAFRFEAPRAPELARQAAEEAATRFSGLAPRIPSSFDLEETYRLLVRVRNVREAIDTLPRKHIRRAPWVMFVNWSGKPPLADHQPFIDGYLRHVRLSADGAAIFNLCQSFLRDYPVELPAFKILLAQLPKMLQSCSRPRCRRLLECARKYKLLRSDAPRSVWMELLESDQPIPSVLEDMGLVGELEGQGLAAAAFHSGLRIFRGALKKRAVTEEQLDRVIEIAAPLEGRERRPRFTARQSRIAMVDALLEPFASGPPAHTLKASIRDLLLDLYGDPRLDMGKWSGASETALQVMFGWLVEETLEDFFRLLEQLSKNDSTAKRHWRYRKAFWQAYLRKGAIQGAWVVLSTNMDHRARRALGRDGSGYGRFPRGSGVLSNHAALILEIGGLVLTEWSHTGRYRAWTADAARGDLPKLYRAKYVRDELVNNPHKDGTHHGAENGRWQQELSRYIREQTGIQISHRELMPR